MHASGSSHAEVINVGACQTGMIYSVHSLQFESFLKYAATHHLRMERRGTTDLWSRERMTLNYRLFQ